MYVTTNPLVQDPGWASAGRFLGEVLEPSTVRGYYQPLTMISLMLDWQWGARDSDLTAFHRTSLALHIANTVLIIVLLYMLFRRPLLAAIVGLIFGLHPITVEPIAWIVERKTLLAAFFSLWALLFYVAHAHRPAWLKMAACVLAYGFAVLSKPTAIPLPLLLVLMDVWPLRRLRWRPVLLEKIPLYAVAAAFSIITIVSQSRAANVTSPSESGLAHNVLIVCYNVVFYLRRIVWPYELTSHFIPPDPLRLSNPAILISVIGTLVLLAALAVAWRKSRAPAAAWLWFTVGLFPTMGVIGFTTVIAADKYAYLPAVGLLMVLTYAIARIWDRPPALLKPAYARAALLILLVAVIALEIRQTRRAVAPWRDTPTLYAQMLRQAPLAHDARHNMALWQIAQGTEKQTDQAIANLRYILEHEPHHVLACNELGELRRKQGKTERAIELFESALNADEDYVPAITNLGLAYLDQNDYEHAVELFDAGLEIDPDDPKLHLNKGNALLREGKLEQAIKQYDNAIRLRGQEFPRARYNKAIALRRLGRIDEAIQDLERALRTDPNYQSARIMLNELKGPTAGGTGS
jgi:tetratricopeptide (TPR) repeat protein